MSHVSKIELEIKSLEILKKACESLGFIYNHNLKTFAAYEKYNPCDAVIQIDGCDYEVGVVKVTDKTWSLHWDNWHAGGLVNVLGENAGVIKQAYTVEAVKQDAKLKKYKVTEKKTKTGIRLILAA
jgi:hypothetical protein